MNPLKAIGQSLARGIAAMSGWTPARGSIGSRYVTGQKFGGALAYPSAFDYDYSLLRARARQSHFESPEGRALVGRMANCVVGSGLMLESSPSWDLIDPEGRISPEDRRAWVKDVQTRFNLWANSRDGDATGRKTFYELQGFEFTNRLKDGETIVIIRYSTSSAKSNPVELQFIDPDQVATPFGRYDGKADANGIRIIDGFEIDASGREIAIHVQDPLEPSKFTRIPVDGSTRKFVLHPAIIENIGQVRGMPLLAPFIHEISKITDYKIAELEAAVLNASIAGWVEPSQEANSSRPLAAGQGPIKKGTPSDTSGVPGQNAGMAGVTKSPFLESPGLWIQNLKAGEKFNSYDTKRPNVNFGNFVLEVMKGICAGANIPVEVLYVAFTANYSPMRGALTMFWNVVETWRYSGAASLLNPVFACWLDQEIAAARVSAPGWNVPLIRQAWLNCNWTGLSKPSIDPLKEAKAAAARVDEGHSTREFEALQYNNSDFHANVDRLIDENQRLAQARMPLVKLENTVFNGVDSDGNPLTADPTKAVGP